MLRTLPLFLLAFGLVAADPEPGTYRSEQGLYLTIADGQAVVQLPDGQSDAAFRLVRDTDELRLYVFGRPSGATLLVDATGVVLVHPDERQAFAPCPDPPDTIGMQPYQLPPTEPDAARRKAVANELLRRFALEQRLRQEAIAASGGHIDAASMASPDIAKKWEEINATDVDNQRWLLTTLRSHGWIGRKSHGPKAHEALLLIGLHNVHHLRLGATILANMRAEFARKEIDERPVANIADRFALVTGRPLTYGIQGAAGADGKPIIPIIAEVAEVEANRKRIGEPPLATAAARLRLTIVPIDAAGRHVAAGAATTATP